MFYVCLYLDSIIQCIKRVFESINSAPSRWGRELRRTRVIRVRNVYHIRINTCETSVSRCDHSSRMIHVLRVYHKCITDPLRDTCITVYQSCVSQHDTLSLCISVHQGHPLDDTCIKTCITIVLAPMMMIHSDTL